VTAGAAAGKKESVLFHVGFASAYYIAKVGKSIEQRKGKPKGRMRERQREEKRKQEDEMKGINDYCCFFFLLSLPFFFPYSSLSPPFEL